jgi:hypothetical protein
MNASILRKSFFALLIGLVSFSMTACFLSKPMEFSGSGITITLNDNFLQGTSDAVAFYLESTNHIFMGNRESKQDLTEYDIFDLEDYIEAMIEGIETASDIESYSDDETEFYYAYYTSTIDGDNFGYMLVVMEGQNYFYAMNFACFANKLDKNKTQYMNWAKTIRVE